MPVIGIYGTVYSAAHFRIKKARAVSSVSPPCSLFPQTFNLKHRQIHTEITLQLQSNYRAIKLCHVHPAFPPLRHSEAARGCCDYVCMKSPRLIPTVSGRLAVCIKAPCNLSANSSRLIIKWTCYRFRFPTPPAGG